MSWKDIIKTLKKNDEKDRRIAELEKELKRLRDLFKDWSSGKEEDDEWRVEAKNLTDVLGDEK